MRGTDNNNMLSSVGVPRGFHLRKRRPCNATVVYSYLAFRASSRELYLITKSPGHFHIVLRRAEGRYFYNHDLLKF